jgi:hypothetical protein
VRADRKPPHPSRGFAHRDKAMQRTAIFFAAIGVMSIVVTAFAEDRPPRPANVSKDAHQRVPERGEPIIRPPALIPSSGGYPRAVASPSSADRHVAEFLRWTEQHPNPPR